MEAFGEHGADSQPGRMSPALARLPSCGAAGFAAFPPRVPFRCPCNRLASDGAAAAGRFCHSAFRNARFGISWACTCFAGVPGAGTTDLEAALALLDSANTSAPEELAGANFLQAADFAELTEELSRRIEHLQLQAASAVDRTRTEAINAAGSASRAAGWTTGWGADPEPAAAADMGSAGPSPSAAGPDATTTGAAADSYASESADAPAVPALPARSLTWSPADDGCRNTAEFLRVRLRISTAEARRRLALAAPCSPAPASPPAPCHPPTNRPPPPSPPGPSPPAPEPSSPPPWTRSATSPTPTPWRTWNTP